MYLCGDLITVSYNLIIVLFHYIVYLFYVVLNFNCALKWKWMRMGRIYGDGHYGQSIEKYVKL